MTKKMYLDLDKIKETIVLITDTLNASKIDKIYALAAIIEIKKQLESEGFLVHNENKKYDIH